MRWKTTLILLLATIGIGAYISLYEIRQPSQEERERLANQVLRLPADEITQLVLDTPHAKLTLTRNGTSWRLVPPTTPQAAGLAPQQLRADPALVSKLVGALDPLMAQRTLAGTPERPLDPKAYGLDPAVGWIRVVAQGTPTTLLVGETTPVKENRYLQVKGRPEIFVVPSRLFDDANQAVEQFRDPLLIRLDPWQADRITLTSSARSLTVARQENAWHVTTTGLTGPQLDQAPPLTDLADRGEVNAWMRTIGGVMIKRFLDDAPQVEQLATYGFDHPKAELTILQKDQPTVTLFFGHPLAADASLLYAKRSDEPSLYAVAAAEVEGLLRDPHGLRSTLCFDFFTGEVTKLEVAREETGWTIERTDLPAAARQQAGGTWHAADPDAALDEERVEEFLNELVDLRLGGFVDDAPADLARYGLEPPMGTLTIWTSGADQPQRLFVGSPLDPTTNVGGGVDRSTARYGRIEGRQAVVRLPELVTDLLAKTLDSLRAPAPSQAGPVPSQAQPAPQPTGAGSPAPPSK